MKAMQLTALHQVEMREVPNPEIRDSKDVLIKMKVVGVCGSDVHYYDSGQIGSQVVDYPFTVGHEGAGIVEAVGSAVTRVKPGDRIAVEPAISCGVCDQCRAGRHHTCRKLRFLGCPGQAEGCLSEWLVMPEESCFPISAGLTLEQAALSEPLAIGVYAAKKSVPMLGAKIGILGFGPIGLSVLFGVQAMGAESIYVSEKLESRRQAALAAGADWAGNPDEEDITGNITDLEPLLLDAVFECCGQQDAVFQAVEMLKPGGKLMLIGIPPTLDNWSIPVDKTRRKEICIQNVRRQVDCVEDALAMIANGRAPMEEFATHHFKFEETKRAFDLVNGYEDGVMKAMIELD